MSDLSFNVAPSREEMMANIVSRLQITGGAVPTSEQELWRQIAIRLGVSPRETVIATARHVFAQLGESWDDDYLEEDLCTVALAAYEVLYNGIAAVLPNDESSDSDAAEEEEDEDEGIDAGMSSIQASVATTNIAFVVHMLRKGEWVLNPEWQRSFVWKPQKMQRLVESILLGLPIPSLLLYRESESGKTYVIDGRQRLETISRYMSPVPEKGQPKLRFRAFSSKYEGWRTGQYLNRAAGKFYSDLPADLRSKFDSAPIVTCTFSDLRPGTLYQIFKRYNTGAVALNPAEIRNAVYQASPLHAMIYRVAGEHRRDEKYVDDVEKEVGNTLRRTMGEGKFARYGGYDFVGRYFAFGHMKSGTVASATNQFMERYAKASHTEVERFRLEFLRVFRKTAEWYMPPFTKPYDGKFHAFFATVQLVSTLRMLEHIDAGEVEEETIVESIAQHWFGFAASKAEEKQNASLFWSTQREWVGMLEREAGVTLAALAS